MDRQHESTSRVQRVQFGTFLLILGLIVVALMTAPSTALGQTPTGTTTPSAVTTGTPQTTATAQTTAAATAQTTAVPAASVSLSTSSGLPGASITANGSGFKPDETVDVSFNGQSVGTPTVNSGGSFSLSFTVPNASPGQYGVLAKGQTSGNTASTSFTVNQGGAALSFSVAQAAPGASLTVSASGFQPGETVQVSFNGAEVGSETADTRGSANVTFTLPTLAAGAYDVTARGETSGLTNTAPFTLIAPTTPVASATVTATPAPAANAAQGAPAILHDDRYFTQTGYRIDNDEVWAFFQQFGGTSAFGFPVSRNMVFLGCPVQMFQRHIIQVCPGQGAALINLLDPEVFPYTKVNGSTFPAPDATIKSNTPPVGSPTYASDISNFVQTNVPDTFNGQQVNFLQTFNTLGGLTIWGAPISKPEPDPSNSRFIYQRFQRGIMHFIQGSGTQSILLADYLKAIIMNKDVPPDLLEQSRETRFFNQYCPGQNLWLCRPGDLPGTDLTFAFVNG